MTKESHPIVIKLQHDGQTALPMSVPIIQVQGHNVLGNLSATAQLHIGMCANEKSQITKAK